MSDPIEEVIAEMRLANDQVDDANGTSDYNTALVALALIAREFLRRYPAEPKIASREDVKDVYAEGLEVGMDLGKQLGVKQETHDFVVRYAVQTDRELIALRSVVASLVNWARSRQAGYPFDHNGECLICDEMGEHADDCTWPIVERSVFATPDCLCRTPNCGHEASKHVGPYGACIVAGCDCGPKGWS